jgi:hypothetical protein
VTLYEELFDQLGAKQFVADKEQAGIVRDRLQRAAKEFDLNHVFAINMCLHAASSIILNKPENLKGAVEVIRGHGLRDEDPTTILTVTVLYYLVNNKWDPDKAASEKMKDQLQKLARGFDAINWLIGEQAMQVLGLSKLPPKIQAAGTPVEQQQQEQKQVAVAQAKTAPSKSAIPK